MKVAIIHSWPGSERPTEWTLLIWGAARKYGEKEIEWLSKCGIGSIAN
jgi:hypothetical protein